MVGKFRNVRRCSSSKEGNFNLVFPSVLELSLSFVVHCGMLQLSAAYCMVRVTAGCGRPSAFQTSGRYTMPCAPKCGISIRQWDVFRSKTACAASPQAAALDDATHTSRAALRPGTEAVGFCGDSWVCEFQTSEHCVDARVLASRGFGSAESFSC